MSYLTRKVTRRMKRRLEAGERVEHAAPAARLGGTREYASGLLRYSGLLPAVAVSGRVASGGKANIDPRAAGPLVPLPERCTVALTDRRILIFSNSYLTNKPSKLVYEVPRAHVEWVGAPIVDPGILTKTERIVIGVRGPAVVGWEVPRVYLRQGRALLASLTHQDGLEKQEQGPVPQS